MDELDLTSNTIDQCKACAYLPRERILGALCRVAQVLSGQSESAALSSVLHTLERELGMARGTVLLLSADRSELLVEAFGNHETMAD